MGNDWGRRERGGGRSAAGAAGVGGCRQLTAGLRCRRRKKQATCVSPAGGREVSQEKGGRREREDEGGGNEGEVSVTAFRDGGFS